MIDVVDVVDDWKLGGGDWNMTGWHDFPIILGIIIPTDELHNFSKG